jgi:hypothetical protein
LVIPEQLVQPVLQAQLVPLEQQEELVRQDQLAQQVHLEPLEPLEILVLQEEPVLLVRPGQQVLRELQEQQETRAQQVQLVIQEIQVKLDP